MSQFDVYGFGNALVDHEILVQDEDLKSLDVKKSLMILVDEERQAKVLEQLASKLRHRSCGGSAANTVITLQQLGSSAFYSYRVANDEAGDFFYADLKRHGVHSNFDTQTRPEGTTGKCLVMVSPDSERSMETFLGITSTVSEAEINYDSLLRSKYFYIEGYLVASPSAKEAVIKARDFCKKNGVKTCLTFSDPGIVDFFREGMQDIVGTGLDLIFANEHEAMSFTQTESVEDAAEKLKAFAKMFVITRSAKGSLVWDGENFHSTEGIKVKAIDANGAGDVYAGAFLAAINQTFSLRDASRIANFAASRVVAKFGARLEEPQVKEVKEFMASLA